MTLEFKVVPHSDPLSIRVSGRLGLGPRLLEFGRHVGELITLRRPTGVLLDLSDVEDIDSSGLGELVILFTTAGQKGCRLCLVSPTSRTVRLLETTRLVGILRWFERDAEAIAWIQDGK